MNQQQQQQPSYYAFQSPLSINQPIIPTNSNMINHQSSFYNSKSQAYSGNMLSGSNNTVDIASNLIDANSSSITTSSPIVKPIPLLTYPFLNQSAVVDKEIKSSSSVNKNDEFLTGNYNRFFIY